MQGKISRPCQAVRDRRHEITFGVVDSLLSRQTQHRRQERRARRGGKETSEGVLLGELFAQHPFAAELRAATLVMRSGPPELRAGMPKRVREISVDTHVLAKLSPCSRAKEKKIPQLRSTVFRRSLLRKSRKAQPPLFSGLHSGFVVEVHILGSSAEVVGLPSAMRPLPITNGKEEWREKSRGRGDVAALATALLSATARF